MASLGPKVFFLLIPLISVMSSPNGDLDCPFAKLKGDVVVIHGMTGARLIRRDDKKLLFITKGLVYDKEHPNINLDIKKRGGEEDNIVNDGFLTDEPWYPYYTPFLDAIQDAAKKSNGRFDVHLFDFDFRRDNMYTARNFMQNLSRIKYGEKELDSNRSDGRGRRLTVFAHSMGGVITYAVANMRPGLIDAAVFAGTPFMGTIASLGASLLGMPIGNNSVIFNPQNLFLLRSGFNGFPLDGKGLLKDGKDFIIDYYNADNWVRYGLSPETRTTDDTEIGSYRDRMAYLYYAMRQAKRIKHLVFNTRLPVHKLPKVAVIQGEAHDTVHSCPVSLEKNGFVNPDFRNVIKKPGDGVVTVETSTFPIAGAVRPEGVVRTKEGHETLFNDLKAVRQAINAVA